MDIWKKFINLTDNINIRNNDEFIDIYIKITDHYQQYQAIEKIQSFKAIAHTILAENSIEIINKLLAKKDVPYNSNRLINILDKLSLCNSLENNKYFILGILKQTKLSNHNADDDIIISLIELTTQNKLRSTLCTEEYRVEEKSKLGSDSELLARLIENNKFQVLMHTSIHDFLRTEALQKVATMIANNSALINLLTPENKDFFIERLANSPQLLQTYLAVLYYQQQQPKSFMQITTVRSNTLLKNLTTNITQNTLDATEYKGDMKTWARGLWQPGILYAHKDILRKGKYHHSRIELYKQIRANEVTDSDLSQNYNPQPPTLKT